MTKAIEDFSESFYPFLHDSAKDPVELTEQLGFSLLEKARESIEVKKKFFDENKTEILSASLALARAFHRGRKLLVCGNGGSATDAQHIAVEFMHPITVGRKALPAICLNNDMAMVTAVANDVNFADVFVRQLIALGKAGDVLIAISTSGNSENLLHAFQDGTANGADNYRLCRRRRRQDGGDARAEADRLLLYRSDVEHPSDPGIARHALSHYLGHGSRIFAAQDFAFRRLTVVVRLFNRG